MTPEDREYRKRLYREIRKVGVPSFLETLFATFVAIIDSKMVSVLGVTAISAVSVTNQPRLFFYSIFFALNTVTTSLVAKYHGMRDPEAANRVLDHGLKLTVLLSVALSVLGVALARPIMVLFSGQADTLEESIAYLRIVIGGMIFNVLFMEINSALRGVGKTKLTFYDNLLAVAVNIFFNYLLISGRWGFPALGVAGAAIATVLGNMAGCLLSAAIVCNRKLFVNFRFCLAQHYRMTGDSLREMMAMTRSCAIDNLSTRASLLLISGITARIGSFQMAVYSVGCYLLNVNYALGTGLQTASVALIGRTYGEGDYRRLKDYRKAILKLGICCAVVLAVLFAGGGRTFFAFFSKEEAFVTTGAYSCIFIGVITIFQTLKFIYNGFLQGVGMMKEAAFCSIAAFSCVNLLMVALLVLVLHWEIWGVWIGSLVSQFTHAFMLRRYIAKAPVFSGVKPEESA